MLYACLTIGFDCVQNILYTCIGYLIKVEDMFCMIYSKTRFANPLEIEFYHTLLLLFPKYLGLTLCLFENGENCVAQFEVGLTEGLNQLILSCVSK